MKKYDKYKDSRIEWIGDASTGSARGIPEHWKVNKLKSKRRFLYYEK